MGDCSFWPSHGANADGNVRFWPLADIPTKALNVRFRGKADISFLAATRSATSELLRIEHAIVAAGVDQLVLR